MKVRLRFVIGCTLLALGLLCISAGAIILCLAKVFPSAFPPYAQTIFAVLEAIGILVALAGNFMAQVIGITLRDLFRRRKRKRIASHIPHFPFDIITEPGEVLPSLLPGPGLIPEHKIPYHRRQADKNITEELRTALFGSRKILVTGVAGIGKTREIGKLLSDLIDEGFTVLRARINARFDTSVDFPENLQHSLVFLFDDMHQRCADPSISLAEEDIESEDFLDSLRRFLERAERRYTSSDIYAVFVSRSDAEAWNYLQFPSHRMWRDVARYELPDPDIDSQRNFILNVAARLKDLRIDADEAQKLAEANDGTFRNLIQNLYRAKLTNIPLTLDTFTKHGQTWSNRYRALCNIYPREIPVLFDVLNTLSAIGMPPYPYLVVELATSLLLGFRSERIAGPIRWLIKRRVLRVVSDLQVNGDLRMDPSRQEYIVHEVMLAVRQSDLDIYRIIPIIWRHTKRLTDCPLDLWLNLANYAIHETRQLKLGIQILNHLLRINPSHAGARHLRGTALMYAGFLDHALEDLKSAQEIQPKSSEILHARGIIHAMMGNLDLAKGDFDQASLLDPDNAFIFANRSNVFEIREDHKSAESDLGQAIKLRPDHALFYIGRARVRWALGERRLAEADLSTSLEKQPTWASVYIERANFYLVEIKDLDAAERDIDKAIELAPRLAEPYAVKASIACQRQSFEDAERYLDKAIQLSPYASGYYYARAGVRQELGRLEESLADLDQAIILNSRNPLYCATRGAILSLMGMLDLAYRDLKYSLTLDSNNPKALFELSRICGRWGRKKEALETINRCLEISPEWDQAYHLRAHILASQREFRRAMKDFGKAAELAPEDGGHYYCRGELQGMYLRKKRQALRDLGKAKELSPEKIQAHCAYIAALRDSGRHKRARDIYLGQVNNQPDNPVLLVSYAYACMLDGDRGEAEEYLRRSFEFQVEDHMISYYQLLVARACRKWGLLWRYFRCLISHDEAFTWEYLLHVYANTPVPRRLLQRLVFWMVKTYLTNPTRRFKERIIQLCRLRDRRQRLTERDLALT